MKLQSGSIFGSIAVFVWCLFMGVTVGSIAVGAIYPPANMIAKPFVCPNGKMSYDQATYHTAPGTTVTTTTWHCVDNQTGEKTELGLFPMSLYAGLIYGLVFYGVLEAGLFLGRRGKVSSSGTDQARLGRETAARGDFNAGRRTTHADPTPSDALARMQQLKELRAAHMISEAEYEQKRAEILKGL